MDTSAPGTTPQAIVAEHLHKRYRDKVAVDDMSFTLGIGETLGIVGANGAGKTTTVEMVAGLRNPMGDVCVSSASIRTVTAPASVRFWVFSCSRPPCTVR